HGQILPFLMFELTSVAIGASKGALDVYGQMLRERKLRVPPYSPLFESPDAQRRFGDAQGLVDTAEAALLGMASDYLRACSREQTEGVLFDDVASRRMHRAQEQCVELAWQAMDLMFRSAGTSAAGKSVLLGRYFRDLAVIRTHTVVQPDQTS